MVERTKINREIIIMDDPYKTCTPKQLKAHRKCFDKWISKRIKSKAKITVFGFRIDEKGNFIKVLNNGTHKNK